MKTLAIGFLAVAIVAAACGAKDETANSAGGNAWMVDSMPLLDLGKIDTLETFGDVNGAARTADGGVVVADRMSPGQKYFAPDGRYLLTVGRKGSGPGEFDYLADMLRCGDSLFVRDIATRKTSVFSIKGVYARQFEMLGDTIGQQPYHSACNADRVFIHNGWFRLRELPAKSGPSRGNVPYWTSIADGSVRNRLGQFAWTDRWVTVGKNGGGGSGPLPLGRDAVIAASRSRYYIGTADSFHINVFALDGSPQAPILKPGAVRATLPADIERYKLLDTTGKPAAQNKRQAEYWDEIEFPRMLPAYTAFVVDSDDNLWVRSYPPAIGESVTWTVFSSAGAEIAAIDLPSAFTVFEIGKDYILGALTDVESGLKRVQVLKLRRGS